MAGRELNDERCEVELDEEVQEEVDQILDREAKDKRMVDNITKALRNAGVTPATPLEKYGKAGLEVIDKGIGVGSDLYNVFG